MHSLLAKGRLLYTHDETIADLCARLHAIGERDTQMQLLRAATHALPSIYKAHKWLITRGDLDYTALWILYAATPLAQIEVHRRRADRGPRGHSAGDEAEPGVLQDRSTSICSTRRRRGRPSRAALEAVDRYLAERAPTLFAPLIDHLREVGEARSCTEIEDHFRRHFDVDAT